MLASRRRHCFRIHIFLYIKAWPEWPMSPTAAGRGTMKGAIKFLSIQHQGWKSWKKTGPKTTFRRLLRRRLFSTKIYRKAIVHISPERMGVTIIYCCHKGFSSYCMSKPLLYHERRKKRCSVYSLFSSFTEFSKDRKWYEATFSSLPLE